MIIDKPQEYKLKGRKCYDHNTFINDIGKSVWKINEKTNWKKNYDQNTNNSTEYTKKYTLYSMKQPPRA